MFLPLLQRGFPEITDFFLPPEGCSYRMALVPNNLRKFDRVEALQFDNWAMDSLHFT